MPTQLVRCYAPGSPTNSHNYEEIPLDDARYLVAEGMAESFKRGRSIRLFARSIVKLRDRSCSWSHRLMELVGEGNYVACQMLKDIRPQIRIVAGGGFPYENRVSRDNVAIPVDEFIAVNHAGCAA